MSIKNAAFEKYESNVRTYCRSFPAVFVKGKNALLYDEEGKEYIDFFAGAGSLNYGHNPEFIQEKLIAYLKADHVMNALDMYTPAKREFIENFVETILIPRNLDYKIQFCGPTGANAVEAALKLARLYTKRPTIASFSGGWHGMTAGALSITGNVANRQTAGFPLSLGHFLPYPSGPYGFSESMKYIESLFSDPNSGFDLPAAIILETVQAEGGINVATEEWLRDLRAICDRYKVLLIIDDIQAGCGRTGRFFSFERAGIIPDIVCLSKSIGGYGLPMAINVFKRELDIWTPGQHTGTFRGNQLSLVAATAALSLWKEDTFQKSIIQKEKLIKKHLSHLNIEKRGLGMIWGIDMQAKGAKASADVQKECFNRGLIIERSGRDDTVLKILPPLTIEEALLEKGCKILSAAVQKFL